MFEKGTAGQQPCLIATTIFIHELCRDIYYLCMQHVNFFYYNEYMRYDFLGTTDIKVSKICVGTMTWGYQNTQEDAFEQIDYALSQGINFIDTAEIYAVPPSANTYGKTEEMIGNYFAKAPRQKKGNCFGIKNFRSWHELCEKRRGLYS